MNIEQGSSAMAEFVQVTHNRRLIVRPGDVGMWNWEISERYTTHCLCSGTIDPGYYAEDVMQMIWAINGSFGPYSRLCPPLPFGDWKREEIYTKVFDTREVTVGQVGDEWGWYIIDLESDRRVCWGDLPAGQSCEAVLAVVQKALDDLAYIGSDRQLPAATSEPTCVEVQPEVAGTGSYEKAPYETWRQRREFRKIVGTKELVVNELAVDVWAWVITDLITGEVDARGSHYCEDVFEEVEKAAWYYSERIDVMRQLVSSEEH